jgi:hypothetical protein
MRGYYILPAGNSRHNLTNFLPDFTKGPGMMTAAGFCAVRRNEAAQKAAQKAARGFLL